ncbi:MAG: hypothetical protein LDL39_11550 [Magnetospirillum sp.]|nr:hypothetical protein [Magnetospirillum sp.]
MASPITSSRPGHVEIVLTDVVHRRKVGQWPDGKVPRWATDYAAQLGTKAGSVKFDDALERWYVRELEAALKPFAEAGAALDPRTDSAGTAVSVQDRDGKKHVVTYGRLRQAARVLGEGLRKVESRAEIINRYQLLDDKVLWQIRWMAAYADKPRWLLLRETPMADGRRKLEALSYSGEVRASRVFQPTENDNDMKASLSRIYAVPALQDAARLEAIGFLAKAGDMKTGRGLDDAYRNQVSDDSRERCHRRRWSVVSDVHVNVGGMPGDRLIRLRWLDAPTRSSFITGEKGESDLIIRVGIDGEAKVVYGHEPWRPLMNEPRWKIASFVFQADRASKLLAGIAAGSARMIAEAVAGSAWDQAKMSVAEADRVSVEILGEG